MIPEDELVTVPLPDSADQIYDEVFPFLKQRNWREITQFVGRRIEDISRREPSVKQSTVRRRASRRSERSVSDSRSVEHNYTIDASFIGYANDYSEAAAQARNDEREGE